jgi:hypothetical protein
MRLLRPQLQALYQALLLLALDLLKHIQYQQSVEQRATHGLFQEDGLSIQDKAQLPSV